MKVQVCAEINMSEHTVAALIEVLKTLPPDANFTNLQWADKENYRIYWEEER